MLKIRNNEMETLQLMEIVLSAIDSYVEEYTCKKSTTYHCIH